MGSRTRGGSPRGISLSDARESSALTQRKRTIRGETPGIAGVWDRGITAELPDGTHSSSRERFAGASFLRTNDAQGNFHSPCHHTLRDPA